MRPSFVVISSPELYCLLRVAQITEPLSAQAFLAELAVETLDEGVLNRLPRPNELKRYPVNMGPKIESSSREFRSVITDDTQRQSPCAGKTIEHLDYAQSRK